MQRRHRAAASNDGAGGHDRGDIVLHPFVIGELVLGHVPRIAEMMDDLNGLPQATLASVGEVLQFISDRKLPRAGIGYVDAHLLAAAALTPEASIGTRDRRLLVAARSLSLAADIGE